MRRDTAAVLWNGCLETIRQSVSEKEFATWFAPTKGISVDGRTITVEIPDEIFYRWIEQNYTEVLRSALDQVLGVDARLRYSLPKAKAAAPRAEEERMFKSQPKTEYVKFSSRLNPGYTFDCFIEGKSNQLAVSAAKTIAARPGKTAFNPILIYGGVGLGKTHLAQAIGNKVLEENPGMKVLYVPSEKFIQQYVDSFRQDRKNDFINFYQSIDLLIIDDVQFFSGKSGSQEVFFHIFNHLHQNGRQLILTADKSPVDMRDMEERLLSRFKWGLQAALNTPDYEHRLRILKAKLLRDDINIPDDVVCYVAKSVNTNVRELEGVVNSLIAQSTLAHREITLELAVELVSQFIKTTKREVTIDHIKHTVCQAMNIDMASLESKSRKRDIALARQVAMYFAKTLTQNYSLQHIGSQIAGRDHSTVLHSCKTVSNLMDTDRKFCSLVDEIKVKILGCA